MNPNVETRDLLMQNKIPAVTIFFWIIKIMATTVGETGADFLIFNVHLGLSLTSLLAGIVLALFLWIQLRNRKYTPWIYWITVVLVSIFGTLITDNLVDNFGVPLTVITAIFLIALIATFVIWYACEKTLSILTVNTHRRELFYWTAILLTFALGTAAGDLVAEGLHLGYAVSALVFGGLIAVVGLLYYFLKSGTTLWFWIAYILTRPFGASFGDWLSQETAKGGLGLGTVGTSGLFLVVILALVIYLTVSKKDDSSAVSINAAT